MYTREIVIATPLLLLLAACGGGSGGTGNTPTPSTQTFSVTLTNIDQCNSRSANLNAKVLFHRQDGSLLTVQSPDATGTVAIPWPNGARHVSVVNLDELGRADIDSWIDWQSGALGSISHYQETSATCEQRMLTIDTTNLRNQYPDHRLYLNGQQADSTTMELALSPEQERIAVHAEDEFGAQAFAAWLRLDDPQQSNLELPIDLFDGGEHRGQPVDVNGAPMYHYGYSFAKTDEGRHFRVSNSTFTGVAYYFPGINTHSFYSVFSSDILYPGVSYYQGTRERIDDSGSVNLSRADNQQEFVNAVLQALAPLAEGGNSLNYDLTGVSNRASALGVDLTSPLIDWSIDAPLAGTLPILEMTDDIQALLEAEDATELNVTAWGFGDRKEIHSFRRTMSGEMEDADPFRDSYHYQWVTIEADQ